MTYALVQQKPRLKWTDLDWANYLNCPIWRILEYKSVLHANFLFRVRLSKANDRYVYELFQKVDGPKGKKRYNFILADWFYQFKDEAEEIRVANEFVSGLSFKDEVADNLCLPKRAIQMMLIREK